MLNFKKFTNRLSARCSERVNFGFRKRISDNSVIAHFPIRLNQSNEDAKCAGKSGELIDLVWKVFHATGRFLPAILLVRFAFFNQSFLPSASIRAHGRSSKLAISRGASMRKRFAAS